MFILKDKTGKTLYESATAKIFDEALKEAQTKSVVVEGADSGASVYEEPPKEDLIHMTTAQLKDRLERAQRSELKKLFDAYGVKDEAELKAKLERLGKIEAESMTEQERLKAENEKLKKEKQEAEELNAYMAFESLVNNTALSAGVKPEKLEYIQFKVGKEIQAKGYTSTELDTLLTPEWIKKLFESEPDIFGGSTSKEVTPKAPNTPRDKEPIKPFDASKATRAEVDSYIRQKTGTG